MRRSAKAARRGTWRTPPWHGRRRVCSPWRHVELRVRPELTTVGAPHDHPSRMITFDLDSGLALCVVILDRCGSHYADRTWEITGMRRQIGRASCRERV